jgi:hypothetical protein
MQGGTVEILTHGSIFLYPYETGCMPHFHPRTEKDTSSVGWKVALRILATKCRKH